MRFAAEMSLGTGLVLCGDDNRLDKRTLICHKLKAFLGCDGSGGFGSKVKGLVHTSVTDGTKGGIEGRNSLSGSCGGCCVQTSATADGAVCASDKLALSLTDSAVGELKSLHRGHALSYSLNLRPCEDFYRHEAFVEEVFKLFKADKLAFF